MEFRRAEDDEERYGWIEQVLCRFEYRRLGRCNKGAVLAYLQHLSGYSRAQLTRLVSLWVAAKPLVKNNRRPAHAFARHYTAADLALLAEVDRAMGTLSGPATACVLRRQRDVFKDTRFERLGCEAMSIYHHFPSKRHLLDALVDHAFESMAPVPAALPPMERLRHAMHGWRAMANRVPALYPRIAVHRLNTPTGVRALAAVIGLIADVLPDAELTARHFRTLGHYITGASLDETSGYARGPSAAEPVSNAFIAEHCPRLMACAPFFQPQHWEATYELGLEALLARVEADALALAGRKRQRRAGS